MAKLKQKGANDISHPRLFCFQFSGDLDLSSRQLLAPTLHVQTSQARSKQNHCGGFRSRIVGRGDGKRDAVIPKVTIGIESERNVSIRKICTQHLELRRSEIVNKRARIRREALRCQKRVFGTWGDQRVAVIERARKIVLNLRSRDWRTSRVSKRRYACCFGCIQQMDEKHIRIPIPVADVADRNPRGCNRLAGEPGIVYAPGVGTVMVQINLLWPTTPRIRCGHRSLKSEGVG